MTLVIRPTAVAHAPRLAAAAGAAHGARRAYAIPLLECRLQK
jgi:hypothetical protein